MRFDIITIFPKAFQSYFNTSILKRAQKRGLISVNLHGLRKWGKGRHKQLDDKPYGGGAGMVLTAEPILKAVNSFMPRRRRENKSAYGYDRTHKRSGGIKTKIIVLSAKGKQFNQKMAYDWAKKYKHLILISGRYEGIDERVRLALKSEEISIGPYVLTDGDVAAMAIISAVSRLIPGVINLESLQEESYWSRLLRKEAGARKKGLEYPHYTRPEALRWKGKSYRVPKVLLSGNHSAIATWRKKHSQ